MARDKPPEKKSEAFNRWWVCGRKRTYYTREEAKKKVKTLNLKYKSNKKVYRCQYCDLFHGGELHEEKQKHAPS